jgi:hypothetical protein
MSRTNVERDEATDEARGKRRRRRRHPLLWMLGLVVILGVVLVLVLQSTSSPAARKDVTLGACRAGNDRPTASGTLRNHSSKSSNYVIRVKFTDPQGNTVAEGAAPVTRVGAGDAARWTLTGDRHADGPVKCDLASVSRTAVPGS